MNLQYSNVMSLLTLPLIFINLGGEMLYILEQRLSAQHIPEEKAERVLRDIIEQMFKKSFLTELFSPQTIFRKRDIRSLFDRLAHASIMKLNSASMGKLYDLMVMSFKYQLLHCRHPRDILLITLNHMDAMEAWCADSTLHQNILESAKKNLIDLYGNLSTSELREVRLGLLMFLQDIHTRVSIFLRDHVQLPSGKFILLPEGEVTPGVEIPGVIKIFKHNKEFQRTLFHIPGKYSPVKHLGSLAPRADRGITYGTNMYTHARALKTETPLTRPIVVTQVKSTTIPHCPQTDTDTEVLAGENMERESAKYSEGEQAAKEELNALARLIGIDAKVHEADTFKLTLFDEIVEEGFDGNMMKKVGIANEFDMRIEPVKKDASHLNQIMKDFTMADELVKDVPQDSEDILQLMDAIL